MTLSSQAKNLLKVHQDVDPNITPNAGWRDLPIGGVIPQGGTATQFATEIGAPSGLYGARENASIVTGAGYCPDMSWISEDGKFRVLILTTARAAASAPTYVRQRFMPLRCILKMTSRTMKLSGYG